MSFFVILKILFAHCLGDYVFQTDYLAKNKGKDFYVLFVHSVLYTFAVGLLFGNNIKEPLYWFILITHMILDYLKASKCTVNLFGSEKSALIVDQLSHYLILLLVLKFSVL